MFRRNGPRGAHFGRLVRGLAYVAAATLLPALAAGWGIAGHATATASPQVAEPLPAPPPHDPDKLTAIIVAGTTGAESIDVLVPYEMLAASGRFNVYTVAPERVPLPLFPGSPTLQGTDFLPHYSLAELDAQVPAEPDVVVVPFVPSAGSQDNAPLLAWLRQRTGPRTTLLTICGGSWVAAEAGLLDGRQATSHQNVLPLVQHTHPAVGWVDGRRWVQDGNAVSSAGITAGFDATLRVLEQRLGPAAAVDVATRTGYPHRRFLDDPSYAVPAAGTAVRALNLAYRWRRTQLGVALYDGVGEIDVASIVDLYPRTHASTIQPVAAREGVVTTRHGLHLLARHGLDSDPPLDRIVVPGDVPPGVTAALAGWAGPRGVAVDHPHREEPGRFPVDAVLLDIGRQETRAAAALVARGIEYPVEVTALAGGRWPDALLLRPLLLALLGLAAAELARRGRGGRRTG
jgi:transcriptional regulator GlxA family with amidase domain